MALSADARTSARLVARTDDGAVRVRRGAGSRDLARVRGGSTRCARANSVKSRSSRRCGKPRPGTPVVDICRKMGITETTFYRWKKKYFGLGVSELRELSRRTTNVAPTLSYSS